MCQGTLQHLTSEQAETSPGANQDTLCQVRSVIQNAKQPPVIGFTSLHGSVDSHNGSPLDSVQQEGTWQDQVNHHQLFLKLHETEREACCQIGQGSPRFNPQLL